MSTLFISYSNQDRSTAEIFFNKLIEMKYDQPFLDDHPESGIPAGSRWERELYGKLRLSKAPIVLVSRNWLESRWCFAELAYAKAVGKEFFPVVIDDLAEVPDELADRQVIRYEDANIWQLLRRGLVQAHVAPEDDFPWPVEDFDACPYPGLASFEAQHAGVYFGRDDETLELRERLNEMAGKGEPRLLYVVGASGSGKSSLVKAGLLPRLTRKESKQWCVLPVFRWHELHAAGRDWAERLAMFLRDAWLTDDATTPARTPLRERYWVTPLTGEKGEAEVARYKAQIADAADHFIADTKDLLDARNQPNAVPLLVIDQFEEILSAPDDDSVSGFLDFLGSVMSSPRSPWRCIATVRTDFLKVIQTRAELVNWKEYTGVYSLPLMKSDRFFEVIRHPAEKVRIDFETDALVNRIVSDTGTNDALPLLAFALRELYQRFGSDDQFTMDQYSNELGGVEGCLARVADDLVVESLGSDASSTEERERQLHFVFANHLVRINDEDQFVRRQAMWSDLPTQARPLIQRFIEKRLITSRLRDENDFEFRTSY